MYVFGCHHPYQLSRRHRESKVCSSVSPRILAPPSWSLKRTSSLEGRTNSPKNQTFCPIVISGCTQDKAQHDNQCVNSLPSFFSASRSSAIAAVYWRHFYEGAPLRCPLKWESRRSTNRVHYKSSS